MLRLVEPAPLYKAAILDAVAEMQAIGEWDISPDAFAARFDDMLREFATAKDPVTAPPGVLPYEDFWLMEQDTWIGLLTLRPHINEQFLHSGGHIGYVVRPSKRRCGYGTVLLCLGLDKAREGSPGVAYRRRAISVQIQPAYLRFSGTIYQVATVASTAAWTRHDPQLLHHAHHVDMMMNLTNLLALKGEPDGSWHHDPSA